MIGKLWSVCKYVCRKSVGIALSEPKKSATVVLTVGSIAGPQAPVFRVVGYGMRLWNFISNLKV